MIEKRNWIEIKYAALKRKYLWLNSKKYQVKLVAEYPKSGGTWLTQMLGDLTDLHYYRNSTPELKSCILHGHHNYNNCFYKPIFITRDYRDIIVSFYHHMILGSFIPEKERIRNIKKIGISDPSDVSFNLQSFIDYLENKKRINLKKSSWTSMTKSYLNNIKKVHIVKYEDLVDNPHKVLKACIDFWGYSVSKNKIEKVIHKYDFKNQTKRGLGESKKGDFLRKGGYGDYKNYFSKDLSEKIFKENEYLFKLLDYEK